MQRHPSANVILGFYGPWNDIWQWLQMTQHAPLIRHATWEDNACMTTHKVAKLSHIWCTKQSVSIKGKMFDKAFYFILDHS